MPGFGVSSVTQVFFLGVAVLVVDAIVVFSVAFDVPVSYEFVSSVVAPRAVLSVAVLSVVCSAAKTGVGSGSGV